MSKAAFTENKTDDFYWFIIYKRAIIVVPDKFYALFRSTGFFRYIDLTLYPLIRICKKCKFRYVDTVSLYRIKLVWRQSEFAFFVRRLRSSHFFSGGNIKWKKHVTQLYFYPHVCAYAYYLPLSHVKKAVIIPSSRLPRGWHLLILPMPDKNKTNLAKTPLFSCFLSNSRLKYV